jgi:hypothetical protein
MNSEGLNIPDNALLDRQTYNEIRLAKLQQSPISGLYL